MADDQNKKLSLNVLNPSDKVEQLRRAFAEDADRAAAAPSPAPSDDQATAPPAKRLLEGKIIAALRSIYDPEIPVNIYDLGLIYNIDVDARNVARVRMTLTAPGCPVADEIVMQVESKVQQIPEVTRADVELVFDPPWDRSMMSEAARLELGL